MKAKKPTKRGAVRKKDGQDRLPKVPSVSVSIPLSGVSVFVFVLLASAAIVTAYLGVDALKAKPIEHVALVGEFKYVDKPSLVEKVKPLSTGGYFLVDLAIIKETAEQMPWVQMVDVERRWPNQLILKVTEQTPIAYWGNDQLLNANGELFTPPEMLDLGLLPQLAGSEASVNEVISAYQKMSKNLHEHGLGLSKLVRSDRGSWTASVVPLHDSAELADAGFELFLGRDQVFSKLDRLLRIYERTLKPQLAQLKRIDMRYINGMAVQLENESQHEQVAAQAKQRQSGRVI